MGALLALAQLVYTASAAIVFAAMLCFALWKLRSGQHPREDVLAYRGDLDSLASVLQSPVERDERADTPRTYAEP
jgi:hypothetical protein